MFSMRATSLLLAILLTISCAGRNPAANEPAHAKLAPIRVAFDRIVDINRIRTHSPIPRNIFIVTVGDEIVERQITTDERSSQPVWSPDGRRIAFVRDAPATTGRKEVRDEVHILNPGSGTTRKLGAVHGLIRRLEWSPDGRTLAAESMTFGQPEGGHIYANYEVHFFATVSEDPPVRSHSDLFSPNWSPDGLKIVFTCVFKPAEGVREHRICVSSSSQTTSPSVLAANGCRPRWSPGGKQILYLAPCGQESELFLMNSDGTDARKLGLELKGVRNASWSPDGEYIAFQAPAQRNFPIVNGGPVMEDVFVMHREGAGMKIPGKNWGLKCIDPVWSPDSVSIVARCNKVGETSDALYLLSADGDRKPLRIAQKWILHQTVAVARLP